MAEKEPGYLQPSIPKLDGHYEHWAMLMENLMHSKEYWSLIEDGVYIAPANPTAEQTKKAEESKLKDFKAKNYLFQAIDRSTMETILDKSSAKAIWDSLKLRFQGSKKVREAQLQTARKEFETLVMKEEETVNEYFLRVLTVVNRMAMYGESMLPVVTVRKIMRSLLAKFNYVVCSIEHSTDVSTLSIEGLQSSLIVEEQRMKGQKKEEDEQALKITNAGRTGGRGRGRNTGRGGRGRGRQQFNKETVECYHCKKLGHFRYECPNWEDKANFAEDDQEEEILLMANIDKEVKTDHEDWFLDSGCSNHMCGHKEWFLNLDEQVRVFVKLGNGTRLRTEGKGNVKLESDGITQIITDVYYIPGLSSNLLSIGQLQEKVGLAVVFKQNVCKVYHNERGLVLQSRMAANRMFKVTAKGDCSLMLQSIHRRHRTLMALQARAFGIYRSSIAC